MIQYTKRRPPGNRSRRPLSSVLLNNILTNDSNGTADASNNQQPDMSRSQWEEETNSNQSRRIQFAERPNNDHFSSAAYRAYRKLRDEGKTLNEIPADILEAVRSDRHRWRNLRRKNEKREATGHDRLRRVLERMTRAASPQL